MKKPTTRILGKVPNKKYHYGFTNLLALLIKASMPTNPEKRNQRSSRARLGSKANCRKNSTVNLVYTPPRLLTEVLQNRSNDSAQLKKILSFTTKLDWNQYHRKFSIDSRQTIRVSELITLVIAYHPAVIDMNHSIENLETLKLLISHLEKTALSQSEPKIKGHLIIELIGILNKKILKLSDQEFAGTKSQKTKLLTFYTIKSQLQNIYEWLHTMTKKYNLTTRNHSTITNNNKLTIHDLSSKKVIGETQYAKSKPSFSS